MAPDPAESRGAPPPPQDPSPLRGTLGSSLRSPAEGEGKSFIQYKIFIALPGKVPPKTQKGCDVNPIHVFSVLHITAQVELSQQDLGSFHVGREDLPHTRGLTAPDALHVKTGEKSGQKVLERAPSKVQSAPSPRMVVPLPCENPHTVILTNFLLWRPVITHIEQNSRPGRSIRYLLA